MQQLGFKICHSIVSKFILVVGLVLLVSMSGWAYYNINGLKKRLMENIVASTDRLTNTIRLGTHYSMMLNSRDDITQIISNIGQQREIKNIRIYNKAGQIKYSNYPQEVDQITNIEAEACYICHRTDPPLETLDIDKRTRIFRSDRGYRLLGIITPISNDVGCSTAECHFHPKDKKILGALDVVVSLKQTDREIQAAELDMMIFTFSIFLVTSAIILVFLLCFVSNPIKRLIQGTRLIAKGDYTTKVDLERQDEMGQLALAINQMGSDIGKHQSELKQKREEYQTLFERVPCLITVQDRNFQLLAFNHEFSGRFAPSLGDYCFRAYKGRDKKCEPCPVEQTFADGRSHITEESGINKDGTRSYWLVRTSPIRDANGEIVAAMEISLDITERKNLEDELEVSEKKYHAIFSNIPNPVFVLEPETLMILDCNNSVPEVYGFRPDELVGHSFTDLFLSEEQDFYRREIQKQKVLNQVRHRHKSGRDLFVNIRISPSEYSGRKVLLITTSDITKRLEAEQQLIQASKMATLGEMATGVAHELNQPLSVIKTTSSFFMRKLATEEPIEPQVLRTMLSKVDTNVDRATRIINHMRQFARKSDMELLKTHLNDVLQSAFEIFSQQLKVRGITVHWDLADDLPRIEADAQRLEQVFINLLINARDAIEEKWQRQGQEQPDDGISIQTRCIGRQVVCRICDTGIGIPKEVKDKIFEPFYTTKEVGKGTGLGLSISYGIVKDCRGSIRAEANDPQGACFVMHFQVSDADAATREDERSEARRRGDRDRSQVEV